MVVGKHKPGSLSMVPGYAASRKREASAVVTGRQLHNSNQIFESGRMSMLGWTEWSSSRDQYRVGLPAAVDNDHTVPELASGWALASVPAQDHTDLHQLFDRNTLQCLQSTSACRKLAPRKGPRS